MLCFRLGAASAPWVNKEFAKLHKSIPYVFMAALSFITYCLLHFLPETKDVAIQDTGDEVVENTDSKVINESELTVISHTNVAMETDNNTNMEQLSASTSE